MRAWVFFSALSLAFAGHFAAGRALARGEGKNAESGRSPALPADAIKRLKTGDEVEMKGALDDVRISARAGAPAVPAIIEILERGASLPVSQAAIDTLGDTEVEAASPILASYARHQDAALRRSAVQALAHTRGVVAVKALRGALSDPDPAVRGLAATGLGTLKAKEAVADLFLALDHRVGEASPSIGKLCAGPECEKLAAKLGSIPFDIVTSGLDQALSRPPPDVTEDLKIGIVARVRELGTGQANRFLREEQTKWPKKASPRVKQALDQAVLATSGSPGSQEASP
jgi:hypothetical protein